MRVGSISTDLFDPRDSILMQVTEEEDEVGRVEEVGGVEDEEVGGVEEEEVGTEEEVGGVDEVEEEEDAEGEEEEEILLIGCVLDILDFNIGMPSWGTMSRACAGMGVLLVDRVVEGECNGCLIGV